MGFDLHFLLIDELLVIYHKRLFVGVRAIGQNDRYELPAACRLLTVLGSSNQEGPLVGAL